MREHALLPKPINLKARRAHRVQFFWQILFPLIAGALVLGGGLFWLLSSQTASVERTAQIATILFAVPMLFVGILLVVAIVLLAFGVGQVMKWLPPRTYRVQRGVHAISSRIVSAVDALITPVIVVESWVGAINSKLRRYR